MSNEKVMHFSKVMRYFFVTFAILSNALLFRYFCHFEERVTFSLLNLSNSLLMRYFNSLKSNTSKLGRGHDLKDIICFCAIQCYFCKLVRFLKNHAMMLSFKIIPFERIVKRVIQIDAYRNI